jgi:anti-sigma regulatory factor (Ser/Thr protein kinase)
VELAISPLRTGDAVSFSAFIRDITARKQAEDDLRASAQENARLLDEVRQNARRQRAFLADVLRAVTEGRLRLCESEAELPLPAAALVGAPVVLSAAALRVLRRTVRQAANLASLPNERWQDLLTSAGEAAMNAVVHAGQNNGEARVLADPFGKTVQVWVRDHGPGIPIERLHRATLERGYTTAGTMGHGFWLILRTCDRVYLLTGPTGTTIVLEQARRPPEPEWLTRSGDVLAHAA